MRSVQQSVIGTRIGRYSRRRSCEDPVDGQTYTSFDWHQNRRMTMNGVNVLIWRYFTELVYDVVVKKVHVRYLIS